MKLDEDAYDDLFAAIRVIEGVALDQLHQKD